MKIIPFDIEKAKSGKYKIQTRDGRPVRVICWDKKDNTYNLAALITFRDGHEGIASFTKTGACCVHTSSPLDLVLVDESTPNIRQQIYDIIIKTHNDYPNLTCATQLSAVLLADFIQKELNLPKWKPIKKGEKLPEKAYLKCSDSTIFHYPIDKGVMVENDCWYLPVIEIDKFENEPNYEL